LDHNRPKILIGANEVLTDNFTVENDCDQYDIIFFEKQKNDVIINFGLNVRRLLSLLFDL
jgi:hypothetical protein